MRQTDGQTDVRQTSDVRRESSINAPAMGAGKVNCATLLLGIGGVLISLSKAISP